jgi:hypothetical protein
LAKDVALDTNQASGSSQGQGTDVSKTGVSSSLRWKKQLDARVPLDDLQEEISGGITSAMNVFVERTSLMKKVCIPCSPRAAWRILNENIPWCS